MFFFQDLLDKNSKKERESLFQRIRKNLEILDIDIRGFEKESPKNRELAIKILENNEDLAKKCLLRSQQYKKLHIESEASMKRFAEFIKILMDFFYSNKLKKLIEESNHALNEVDRIIKIIMEQESLTQVEKEQIEADFEKLKKDLLSKTLENGSEIHF